MNKYLTEEQIKDLTSMCEDFFNKSGAKTKIKELSKKYEMNFNSNRANNCENLATIAKIELKKHNRDYTEYIERSVVDEYIVDQRYGKFPTGVSAVDVMRQYVYPHLYNTMTDDWNFCYGFNIDEWFARNIQPAVKFLGDEYSPVDLFYIDDYKKYWSMYSKNKIDKKITSVTDKIIDSIDKLYLNLLEPYKADKEDFLAKYRALNNAIKAYLIERDEQKMHNDLLQMDFWNIERDRKNKEAAENAKRDLQTRLQQAIERLDGEKLREINIEELKISGKISDANFLKHKEAIEASINQYRSIIDDLENQLKK